MQDERRRGMEKNKSVVIDTNVLVRYLTGDDPQKAKAVDRLLDRAAKNEIRIVVPSIVIAELVWVLESFYRMKASDIADLVEALLCTPGVEITEKSIIASALKVYRNKNSDLIDTWIVAFAKDKGINKIYTFDKKHFKGLEGIEVKIP